MLSTEPGAGHDVLFIDRAFFDELIRLARGDNDNSSGLSNGLIERIAANCEPFFRELRWRWRINSLQPFDTKVDRPILIGEIVLNTDAASKVLFVKNQIPIAAQ